MTHSIAQINLDPAKLSNDLDEILRFRMASVYSEYSRGNPGWRSAILFNKSGIEGDAYIKSYEGDGQFTQLASRVPYVRELVTSCFNVDSLLWARVMCVQNGFIMPHRDYLDVDGGLTRIHIPLQTSDSCVNTEEGRAYHMAVGQVCFLDGSKAHSAACLSDFTRVHLCLDFRPTVQIHDVLRRDAVPYCSQALSEVARVQVDAALEQDILDLSRFLDDSSFFEISGVIGLIHFRRDVNCRRTYDWLRATAQRTGSDVLLEKARRLKAEFLGSEA